MQISLKELQELREVTIYGASKHRAFNVSVFGNIARGEQRADSDVDFLPNSTLFDEVRLARELTQILKFKVDLVARTGLKERD